MFSALRLAESGIRVQVIDKGSRTAGHSYACSLHPHTLKLLDQAGIAGEALELGHRIDTIAFYDDNSRRAELKLSELPTEFPFVLVLPQSALEDLLERRLSRMAHVSIHWSHRLADLNTEGGAVLATIDKLTETAKGYIVAEWEGAVEKSVHTSAAFVVGADGHNSFVRRRLDIEYEKVADPEFFVGYEFECDRKIAPEMRVVLSDTTTSVMWPFSDKKCRWTFQMIPAEPPGEFPGKDRSPFVIEEAPSEHDSGHHLQQLLRQRAPWFEGHIEQLLWSTAVQFEHRLANQFGRNRCWLAGDAAHQTGPIGMQSMNVGLQEAADLAATLKKILRENASWDLLQSYNRDHCSEWQRLLGKDGAPNPTAQADPWTKQRYAKIPVCLPASGNDLTLLLNRLGLGYK
jgi:2-polyprenyl-6-methoxyphenol hydroxylase-like FAD-dependent oxidoreductase